MTKRRKRKKPARRQSRFGLWLSLFVAVIAVVAVYVLWLDYEVRSAFEGKRWALPARVYARPLELYVGRDLSSDALLRELEALGYQRSERADEPGEYALNGPRVEFYSRDFNFGDSLETGRYALLQFNNNGISAMSSARGENIPVLRLEPQVIGKIYPEHHEDRILVRYENAPEALINALVAVEDQNFYSHHGVDPFAIARAAWVNLLAGGIRQGGSTLTQQLVKNFYLSQEQNLWRKLNEAIMALLLEAHYSKQEILEAYLNEVYLGQQGGNSIHGFGLAAEFYFRRPLTELADDQLALLVGLVRGASYYNPRRHPERALDRRNLVLRLMTEQGYLQADEAKRLIAKPLAISNVPGWTTDRYPAFVDLVRRQLHREYDKEDLRSSGLRIFTTLDPVAQHEAEESLTGRLQTLERDNPRSENLQGAVILTSVDTGEINALVSQRGNKGFGFNRALDARRQIGSLVKPAVYLTALSQPQRYSVITPLQDMPVRLPQPDGSEWVPGNYDLELHGEVLLYQALAHSYNLATVNLGLELGVDKVAATLERMLPEKSVRHYPSILLGALELTPLQVTQMYQTIAAGGFRTPLKSIVAVLDSDGESLSRYSLSVDQIASSEASYLTTFLLTQVVERGTARAVSARLPNLMPLAGKTGTTDDLRDSWFAGYGSDRLAVVWIGRDDNRPTGLTGSSGALRVWTDLMLKIKPQPLSMTPPEGVRWQKILDGKRTDDDCEGASAFPFIEPYLPSEFEPCHGSNPVKRFFDRIF